MRNNLKDKICIKLMMQTKLEIDLRDLNNKSLLIFLLFKSIIIFDGKDIRPINMNARISKKLYSNIFHNIPSINV